MTPAALATATALYERLGKLEGLLQRLQGRPGSALELRFLSRAANAPGPTMDKGESLGFLQDKITATKDALRALGVVFEPEDAVMPEVREAQEQFEWGSLLRVDGVKPGWLSDDEQVWCQAQDDIKTWEGLLHASPFKTWDCIKAIKVRSDHPVYGYSYRAGQTPERHTVAFGPEIEATGHRPKWLADDEMVHCLLPGGPSIRKAAHVSTWGGPNCTWQSFGIREDHPYYTATERGFVYWPGGDQAPDDWDGGEVLLRSGSLARDSSIDPFSWTHPHEPFTGRPRGGDIIGYKPRAATAAPDFSDDVDPASRDVKLVIAPRDRLQETLGRSAPERLTVTITGPQGCGKTLLARWLEDNLPLQIRPPYSGKRLRLGPVDIFDDTEKL